MEANDRAAVAEVRAGNSEAFRDLVDRHGRRVFRLAYRMTGNEQDAEDIVQETFLRAYRQIGRFEMRSSFSTWLYRIAANCATDVLRQRPKRAVEIVAVDSEDRAAVEEMPGDGPTPEQAVFGSQVHERVVVALGGLTRAERAAFVLRHFEGRSIEEIGRILGLRKSATKHSVFRAVQKMRRALEPVVRSTA